MGQNQSSSLQFPKIAWKQYKRQFKTIIYHDGKGIYSQKITFTQDKKLQPKEQLKIYKYRYDSTLPIVKVYNVQIQQEKKNFCSTMHKMTVWVQYIPNRLSYIKAFTLSEVQCLYVLQQCLKAFHQLFNKVDYFQIKSDMIGFNMEGKVRCWLNRFYQNNRVQNANDSILSGGDTSFKNSTKKDSKLVQTIQRGMVCDLWEIIKRKSNIQNRQLYHKLSFLQSCNFQNASKMVEQLVNSNHSKVPDSLFFQNSIQPSQSVYRQFNYGNVYDQSNSVIKTVKLYDNINRQNNQFGYSPDVDQPKFRDFDLYREYIDSLKPKHTLRQIPVDHLNISFQIRPQNLQHKIDNPESNNRKTLKTLKLVDKTIDISLSSIQQNNSNKTIQDDTQLTIKKIQSDQNMPPPLPNIEKTYSVLVPNAISQRYILNEMPPSSQVQILSSPKIVSSPRLSKIIQSNQSNHSGQSSRVTSRLLVESKSPSKQNVLIVQNYPPIYRTSRYVPPPPLPGIMIRQPSIVGFTNEPNTPQFKKLGYH